MLHVSLVQQIAAWLLPVLLAVTVHETAHGLVARRFGDKTAEMQGRLSLNPIKHIDPIGTILVPGLMLLLPGNFVFGWAKPVPVDWRNFKHPKQDMAWVALAGPASNLLMGFAWAVLARIALSLPTESWVKAPLLFMGVAGIFINTILMVLNLLPLPPLDGGRVLMGLLPGPWSWRLGQIEPYGFLILVVLMATGWLWKIMLPPLSLMLGLVATVSGLPDGTLSQLVNAI